MKTPISFILDLILDYQLPPDALKACRKYVRELETGIGPARPVMPTQRPVGVQQAPSTQKILDEMAQSPPCWDLGLPGLPGNAVINMAPTVPAAQRIVGGEVNTGHGTKGPRKW